MGKIHITIRIDERFLKEIEKEAERISRNMFLPLSSTKGMKTKGLESLLLKGIKRSK